MSDQATPRRLFPPWVEAGTVTALLVPLFYTAGWSYAYHYFERFNLGLMGLDITKEYFFLYSFWTVKDRFWLFVPALVGYLALYVLAKAGMRHLEAWARGPRLKTVIRTLPALLVPLMIFSLFGLFYMFGAQAAANHFDWQQNHDFKSYQRVKVWAKAPETSTFGNAVKAEWSKGCFRLLMSTKDHVYLFYTAYPVDPEDKIPTDIIPFDKIEMLRILTENESCRGKQDGKIAFPEP